MENTRIGKPEAIALILTIMVNHAILNISKSIITSTQSSSLLNTIYKCNCNNSFLYNILTFKKISYF